MSNRLPDDDDDRPSRKKRKRRPEVVRKGIDLLVQQLATELTEITGAAEFIYECQRADDKLAYFLEVAERDPYQARLMFDQAFSAMVTLQILANLDEQQGD
ncbi:MAG: hypothetical protein Fues2KO_11080 [Fuerstiella sp.]